MSKKKKQPKDDGKLRGVQLELFATNNVTNGAPLLCEAPSSQRDGWDGISDNSTAITPENPITDADVPF